MVMDAEGNLYGTTENGGKNGQGVVFKLIPNADHWMEHVLKNFCAKANCTDGQEPIGELIMDVNGSLYGTTGFGGASGDGMVYKLTPVANGWAFRRLVSFNGSDGSFPISGLTYQGQSAGQLYDGSSPLFGVAAIGGAHGLGTAYKLTSADGTHWSITDIHDFDNTQVPEGLVADSAGNLFGTTTYGGKYNQGLLYKLAAGTYKGTVLHNFCNMANCVDGAVGAGRLLIDAVGNLFGETTYGGAHGGKACSGGEPPGCGVVFERTAGGTYQVLYNFCSLAVCADGAEPDHTALAMDASGNLFGVTNRGGDHHGVAFELSPVSGNWSESVLYTFCQTDCADGAYPYGSLIFDSFGNLFGTTNAGGTNNGGTVFELTP
jgi:uncharacterized repeat protein (TIGR03803 family)